jgi:hypothetical protein
MLIADVVHRLFYLQYIFTLSSVVKMSWEGMTHRSHWVTLMMSDAHEPCLSCTPRLWWQPKNGAIANKLIKYMRVFLTISNILPQEAVLVTC